MDLIMVFRFIAILLGLSSGFFSYRIFISTKGATKGWKYLAISGFSLCMWAIISAILMMFLEAPKLRAFSGFVWFTIIAICTPLGIVKLNKSFGVDIIKLYNEFNIIISFLGFWLIMIFLNIVVWDYNSFINEIAGIAHLCMAFMFITSGYYLFFKLWQTARNWIWLLMLLFVIFASLAIIPGAYTSGCCRGDLIDDLVCSGVDLVYSENIPLTCIPGLISITKMYHILLIIGVICITAAFYGLWKKLC